MNKHCLRTTLHFLWEIATNILIGIPIGIAIGYTFKKLSPWAKEQQKQQSFSTHTLSTSSSWLKKPAGFLYALSKHWLTVNNSHLAIAKLIFDLSQFWLKGSLLPTVTMNDSEQTDWFDGLNMELFTNRFASFPKTWDEQYGFIKPKYMAECGFYYVGPEDKIACGFCKNAIQALEPADDIKKLHRDFYPECVLSKRAGQAKDVKNQIRADMAQVANRRKSFGEKSHEQFYLENPNLPEQGFFYIGPMDRIQCICCDGILHSFEEGDDIKTLHDLYFPHCEQSQDELEILDQLHKVFRSFPSDLTTDLLSRVFSFENEWFSHSSFNAYSFATAGFFSNGTSDHVTCFTCKCVIQDINFNEDPWIQHAFWSPDCSYVLKRQGKEYVQTVRNNANILNDRYKQYVENKHNVSSISKELNDTIVASMRERQLTMKEEYDDIITKYQCSVCMDNPRDTVFFPCLHLATCSTCSDYLATCPICKKNITFPLPVFLP